MSYAYKSYKKEKPITDRDIKQYEKLKAEIESSDKDGPEVKRFKLDLLDKVGWRAYTSWFKDKIVLIRNGYFIMYLPNEWLKIAISKTYSKTLHNLKAILHVQN